MRPKLLRRLPLLMLVLVAVASIVSWVTVMLKSREADHLKIMRETQIVTNLWRSTLESQLSQTISTSKSLAGFIAGAATQIPNHNGTVKERMAETLNPEMFALFAEELQQSNPGLYSFQIQPSAVISQVYPSGTAPIGLDLYQTAEQRQDVLHAIASAGTIVAGPFHLKQGPIGLIARTPVFLGKPKTFDTWWGNAACVVMLEQFVAGTGISALPDQGYDFLIEYLNQNTLTVDLIANSTSEVIKEQAIHETVRLPNGFYWDLYVQPKGNMRHSLNPWDLFVLVGVCILIVIVAVCLYLFWWLYHGRRHRDMAAAPKSPPLTLLFTDIESSTNLWMTAPQAMGQALRLHNSIIRKALKKFGAYECKTIGDSFMIACQTVQAALDLSLELQRMLKSSTDWPSEVADFYGVPWMKVRIGVHLCVNAECTFDDVSCRYDYFGKDVNKAARIASKAHGGEIIVSEETAQEAMDLGKYSIRHSGTHVLRGIDGSHRLYQLNPLHEVVQQSARLQSLVVVPAMGSGAAAQHSGHMSAIVHQWLNVLTSDDYDEDQVTQVVLLCRQVITTIISPLSEHKQREALGLFSEPWAIPSTSSLLDHLSLRVAQIVLPKYPTLFRKFSPPNDHTEGDVSTTGLAGRDDLGNETEPSRSVSLFPRNFE